MNDSPRQDTQRLKQMLEEVTAAETFDVGHATSQPGDAETVSLREAWLAFEQLIRAADASLPAMPDVATSLAPRKPHRRRWLGLTAAAALLVAITLGWWIGRDGKQDDRESSLAQTVTLKQGESQPENSAATPAAFMEQNQSRTAVARAKKATSKQPKADTTKTSPWDDPPETQIALVSQQISSVEQNWQHRVDDVDLVQYRIDEVEDSLQNDAI